MRQARWIAVSLLLPLLYIAAVYFSTRRPKPVYAFADPTVMTVTEKPGPPILHSPDPIYPSQALIDRVEGIVKFKVAIAADGTVARAVPLGGPAPLMPAALAALRQYQFEAKPAEADIDVPFSLRHPTRSLSLPEPVTPVALGLETAVRVVVMVDPEGRVQFVQPVSGAESRIHQAVEAVRKWTFRPALRNGEPVTATAVVDVQ